MSRTIVLLAALVALAGCGGAAAHGVEATTARVRVKGTCGTASPPRRWRHVIWIWMENASYDTIVGSRDAPYLNGLARACGLATNYGGVTHPSLPNYLAATSGGTWGIADDGPPAEHTVGRESLFGELAAAGKTWRSYEESMPSNCALTSSGRYAVKHNPAAYYTDSRRDCGRWDVPLQPALASDLRRGRLPAFSFVTPNLCDDMHDCPVASGDAWLSRWVPRITRSSAYRAGSTLLVVTFDEGEGGSNRVATVVVSPSTRPGTTSSLRFDHYSLLRTTEQLLGVRPLGKARSAASMRAAFRLG